ncbi:MAG: ribose-phosphate pyrophosphokinase, partial [Desulfobacterales bacterium]
MDNLQIFAGNSNPRLAQQICENLKMPLGGAKVKRFSDGEIQIEIDDNVRSRDIFVIQSTCDPVNDNLVELLLLIDAFKRASAKRITAVLPYYGYARQDKKVAPRVPISAKLVADLLTVAGAKRVITMDLHAGQIQGFFNIPVDNLFAAPVTIRYIRESYRKDLVIVSPDAGGVERARAFAKRLEAGLAIVDKRRNAPNVAKAMAVIGDVTDKVAVILDDMVDTAGTLTEAAEALARKGAREVHACCSHAVLSGPAVDRITESALKSLVVTDTIPLAPKAEACGK